MYAWLANQNTGGLTQLHAIKKCSVSNKDINTVLVREIRTHDINVETIRDYSWFWRIDRVDIFVSDCTLLLARAKKVVIPNDIKWLTPCDLVYFTKDKLNVLYKAQIVQYI